MTKNKIYLSLDDLYKLYGITPAILNKIIKKKKKRKSNKKKKINNKNMENKKSSSDHMNISSNLLATETQRLNATNIQKHIDDINKKNKIMLENNNEETKENNNDSEIKSIIDGIKSGKFKVKKLSNGIHIYNPELNKKRGPKPKSTRVEDLGETPTKVKINNPLTNIKTNLMGNKTKVIAVDFDDTDGNIAFGLSSDNFMNTSNEEEFDNTNVEDIQFENSKVEELDNPKIENVVNIPLEEQKAGIIETAKSSKHYSNNEVKDELIEVAKQKRVSTRKKGVNIKNK
jgi:hypothetical protein